ncbi:MAG: hypothetical protein K0U98_16565 [Deltaproteobacteria bacterium]|nr:hypothetical protein [Deltaproteobacteria bacterium]
MKKAAKILSLSVAVLATFLFLLHRAAEAAPDLETQEVPNLSGIWHLNQELSEDPREKMSGSRGGLRGGAGRGRGGGGGSFGGPGGRRGGSLGGGGGRSGGSGSRGGGRRSGVPRGGSEGLAAGSERIEIDQGPLEIAVTNGVGRTQVLFADGQEREEFLRGYVTQVVTRWEGAKLVSEFVREAGPTMTRTYELTEDGRLQITIDRAGNGSRNRNGMSFFRVYDLLEESEAASASGEAVERGGI